ncbi:hypothetical protein EDB84DRAFT_1441802 [Lactarius hengduanensis]|nr:hypothetical protein EDB84DRAFT_1441802 [Lactarius hengduanensis]
MSGNYFVMDVVDHNSNLFDYYIGDLCARPTTEFRNRALEARPSQHEATARDFSGGKQKPKIRQLCKNVQKAVRGTASRLLAFIRIGGTSLAVTAHRRRARTLHDADPDYRTRGQKV